MTELWHVGFCHRTLAACLTSGPPAARDITWLPLPGSFRFLADPFCLKTETGLTLFVEAYDYRVRRGEIHYYSYDDDDRLTGRGVALATPFHLSYPYLIHDGSELYMLPEASRSGVLTLYRCERFPDRWVPCKTLLDVPAIDATVVRHDGRWWMFYALPGPDNRAMRELHIAWADSLMGPWHAHAANPVRTGLEASRPGGTPFVVDSVLHLPMQNCVGGYGVGINILRVDALTPETFSATIVTALSPEGLYPGYGDGLHTLAGDGDVTVLDVKKLSTSPFVAWIKLEYSVRKRLGKWRP